ncbi:MAG: helix-turn-helix domain-containing protein [Candidatus Omnitrophica bacterium]|nr:helix-turn-helix domain-containing protein [Candidatus Omnitrophota bacterium]
MNNPKIEEKSGDKYISAPPVEGIQPTAKAVKSPGQALKETRLSKGISLERVHESTKIPLDALRAIEEGYTVKSLSPFYYKGFVKIYANYLEINPGDVLKDSAQKETARYIVEKQTKPKFDLYETLKNRISRENKKRLLIVVIVIVHLFVLFKIFTAVAAKIKSNSGKPKAAISKKANIPPNKPAKQTKAVVAKQEEKKIENKEAKKSEKQGKEEHQRVKIEEPKKEMPTVSIGITQENKTVQTNPPKEDKTAEEKLVSKEYFPIGVTVRAKSPTYLIVKSDGETVFQATLRMGGVETWHAQEKIELSGRDIGELEFQLKGKETVSLGKKGRQAKSILITKDGLTVTK